MNTSSTVCSKGIHVAGGVPFIGIRTATDSVNVSTNPPLLLGDSHCHCKQFGEGEPAAETAEPSVALVTPQASASTPPQPPVVVCGTHPSKDWELIASAKFPGSIVRGFGVHPWYVSAPFHAKVDGKVDEANLSTLPNMNPTWRDRQRERETHVLRLLRSYLEQFTDAIVGEIGLDSLNLTDPSSYNNGGTGDGSSRASSCCLSGKPVDGDTEHRHDEASKEDFLEAQQSMFRQQFRLAAELRRPISVHCVRAYGPLLDILRSEGKKCSSQKRHQRTQLNTQQEAVEGSISVPTIETEGDGFPSAVLLHGFSGSPDFVKSVLIGLPQWKARRLYFGIGAGTTLRLKSWSTEPICGKSAKVGEEPGDRENGGGVQKCSGKQQKRNPTPKYLQEVIPVDRILVESDAFYRTYGGSTPFSSASSKHDGESVDCQLMVEESVAEAMGKVVVSIWKTYQPSLSSPPVVLSASNGSVEGELEKRWKMEKNQEERCCGLADVVELVNANLARALRKES